MNVLVSGKNGSCNDKFGDHGEKRGPSRTRAVARAIGQAQNGRDKGYDQKAYEYHKNITNPMNTMAPKATAAAYQRTLPVCVLRTRPYTVPQKSSIAR